MAGQEIKTVDVRHKLVECDEANNTVHILSCKECSCVYAERLRDKVMTYFRFFKGKRSIR